MNRRRYKDRVAQDARREPEGLDIFANRPGKIFL